MKSGLTDNLISFVVITALTGLVSIFLTRAGLGTSNALVLWIVSLVVLLIVFYSSRRRIWTLLCIKIATIAVNRFREKIGLAHVYNNFNEAAPDVKRAFESSRETRILIQLGEGMIGGDRSLLFETAQKKKGRDSQIKLLYADKASPQLSKARAIDRGSNIKEWEASISFTEASIEALQHDGINIEARRHREPYLWRLFFFDKTLFFVPYLTEKDNSAYAPTFKFVLSDGDQLSLFWPFHRYFEHLWKIQEAASYEIPER